MVVPLLSSNASSLGVPGRSSLRSSLLTPSAASALASSLKSEPGATSKASLAQRGSPAFLSCSTSWPTLLVSSARSFSRAATTSPVTCVKCSIWRSRSGVSKVACPMRRTLIMALSSTVSFEHVAGDDHFDHLAGALGDAVAALLAPHLLDRQVGGERDAAVDLHALVGGAERHLVGVVLADVAILARILAGVEPRGGLVDEQPRRLQFDEHVGQHPLDRLPVGERLAEGRALLGVGGRHFEAALGDAERAGAVLDAADAQPLLAVAHA